MPQTRRRITSLIFFSFIFLTACTNTFEPTYSPIPTQITLEPTSTPSPIPSTTPTASSTPIPTIIKTSSPIPPTATPDKGLSQQCLPVQKSLSPEMVIEGKIVMDPEIAPAYLLDVNSGNKSFLHEEEDSVQHLRISPDGSWLAYEKGNLQQETSTLVVTTNDGQLVYQIAWDDSWRMISGWLDNENLWISKMRGDSPYEHFPKTF